jgi:Tfp pilus assembly protein PilF
MIRANHPDVARALSNLGNLFQDQGELDAAQRHYNQALTILEGTLGPDHPHIGHVLTNLGGIFAAKGDLTKSKTYQQRALTISRLLKKSSVWP